MKQNYTTLLISLIATLIFASCSPNVSKNVAKNYLPQIPDSSFKFYYNSNDVPQNTDIIGTLSITDGGFTATSKCDSVSIFNLAITEVSQSGGNALLITRHSRPNVFGSNCHQVEGMILKVLDSVTIEDLSGLVTSAGEPINNTNNTTPFKLVKPRYLPRATFGLDGGYGWRTAKISPDLDYSQRNYLENFTSGFAWNIYGSYIFGSSSYGIKLTYLQYIASHSEHRYYDFFIAGTLKETHTITFIGPSFIGCDAFGKDKNWILSSYVGLGYLKYSDVATFRDEKNTMTGSTLGFQLGIGLEHKLTPQLGIGINAELINGVLTEMEVNENGYKYTISTNDPKQGEGLGQIRITAGIRYYIK